MVKVLDMLLWFAETSKARGLLGSRQADFLLVCSRVPHSYMLIIPRIVVVAVFVSTYSVPDVMQIISHGMLPSSSWAAGSPYAALLFLLSRARNCIPKT